MYGQRDGSTETMELTKNLLEVLVAWWVLLLDTK